MKIIRFQDHSGTVRLGALGEGGAVELLSGDIFNVQRTGEAATVAKLLAPIVPAAILCIGLNYRRHAEEQGSPFPEYPVLFMKSLGALQNPEDPINLPVALKSDKVDYEGELVVVIGKMCKNVKREAALDYVLGYTCGNDVSARDWQKDYGGTQWCRGKTFDTFMPLGPCIVTTDEIQNPNALQLKTTLSGEVVQDWNTNDMIFDIPRLIEFLSGSTTLFPGTVIMTGTPDGVGMARKPPRFLHPGDTITIEIEKIGALTNPVREERI